MRFLTYLNPAQFKAELERCLNCPTKPCLKACPVNCDPAVFIRLAKIGQIRSAAQNLRAVNPMAHTCGLLCPESFCMKACTRAKIDFPINIPAVQSTIMKSVAKEQPLTADVFKKTCEKKYRFAVIGAGPAGLAASYRLAQNGHQVTLYEQADRIGGALNMIPAERLPISALQDDWSFIFSIGNIDLKLNTRIDNPESLLNVFHGVIVTTGQPESQTLNIEGESFILPYQTYLKNPERYVSSGNIAIIGGGNVAADCALKAFSNGARHVELFVRRGLKHMRMSNREKNILINQGIEISSFTRPIKVFRQDNGLLTLETVKTRLTDTGLNDIDKTNLIRPDWTYIIKAIGNSANPISDKDHISYAGDGKTGASTLVQAIASGLNAAEKFLQNN